MVAHFLITRFAVKRDQEVKPSWFKKRLDLFNSYTKKSVKNQTNTNFEWLVLVDPSFPGFVYQEIFTLHKWKIGKEWRDLSDLILSRTNADWIITSRIDNDDLIRYDFMEKVRRAFNYEEEWLSFPNGYITDLDKVYYRNYYKNPFISRVEKRDNLKTVLEVAHTSPNPRIISEDFMWAQIDHGENLRNSIDRIKPTKAGTSYLLKGFK